MDPFLSRVIMLLLIIFHGCSSETKPKIQPPQQVQIKTLSPKEPFEWTKAEKKRFVEQLKTVKKGDKIEDVVKLLGPPFHSEQHVGKKRDDIRATVIYYYLKKVDEPTTATQEFGPATPKKRERSIKTFDQYIWMVFGRDNRLAGISTNIKGLVSQSVKVANSEEVVLENLDEPMK
jgi:hypothetical protein